MTKRIIKVVDNSPKALKCLGALLVIFAGFCITVLVDMFAWPVTIVAVSSAMYGVWLIERGYGIPQRRAERDRKIAEYERSIDA